MKKLRQIIRREAPGYRIADDFVLPENTKNDDLMVPLVTEGSTIRKSVIVSCSQERIIGRQG